MRFVITGTPRSGTRYTSRLMTALGFRCDHEITLRPLATAVNVARWPSLNIGEASWMAWCWLPFMAAHDVPVLHVIRNPWRVIDSLTNRNHILNPLVLSDSALQGVREIINALLPDLFEREKRVDRAAALVLGWHRLIVENVPQRLAFYVDRLDVPTVRRMLNYLGVEVEHGKIAAALEDVSTSTNSGYTVDSAPGISNPDVARWVAQYAKENDVGRITTRKIRDVAAHQTPEELIERMDAGLVDQVNAYADLHGYPVHELAAVA